MRKLRGRVMPPPGAKQPDGKAVDSLVAWLEDSLDKVPDPGAHHRSGRAASAESQGIRKRRPRSAVWSTSTAPNCCRRMTSRRASTTSRPPCRFRPPSSSNTSSPPATSPSRRSASAMLARRAGRSARLPAISSPTFPDCLSGRAAAFSRKSIFPPTANTASTSPTWPPTSGAMAWSTRIRWW